MLAVSNTSPLRYLIAIEQTDLLAQLFDTVFIPPAIARELSHPAAPLLVRQWIGDHTTLISSFSFVPAMPGNQ